MSEWQNHRLKTIFRETRDTVGERSPDYQLLSLTKGGVIVRDLSTGKGKFPSDFGTYKIVRDGQIIFCLFDIDETPRTVGLSHHNGMITGAYDVFNIIDANPKFVEYFFLSIDDIKGLKPYYTGLRKVVSLDTFLNIRIPLPPRPEQDQIVRYLDWKVSQVNRLINVKKKQIELLQEQKRGIINNAVTKGLNHDVLVKGSGVEWLGEVPEHYVITKLKTLGVFQSGINLTSLQIQDKGEYPVYGGNGLRGYYHEFLFDGSYLLVGRQGALCGNVHKVDGKFWPTEHAVTVTTTTFVETEWLFYMLKVMNLNQYSRAAAQPGLSIDYIKNIFTFYPPLEEQRQIVSYLNEKCTMIDSLVESFQLEISLLHEYRTRLISDVVTGKMDVRNVSVPDFEEVEEAAEEDDVSNDETEEADEE